MPYEPNYFGVAMGDAISAGAGHIASGLEKRYALQREKEIRDRSESLQMAVHGFENTPEGLQGYIENRKKANSMQEQKAQADIDYMKSLSTMGTIPGQITTVGGREAYVAPGGKGRPANVQFLGTSPTIGQEDDLRKEVSSLSKDYVGIKDSYERVKASTTNPSPAGDLALIFNYMKMLDPGSTVREGEFATAATSGSYGDIFKAAMAKIATGERLSDDMRNDFLNRADMLYKAKLLTHQNVLKDYGELAKRRGLKGENVISPNLMGGKESAPNTPLAPNEVIGTLKDGSKAVFDATTKQFVRYK